MTNTPRYMDLSIIVELACDCTKLVWSPPTLQSVPDIPMQKAAAIAAEATSNQFGKPSAVKTAPFEVAVCYTKSETNCDETGKFTSVKW